MATRRERVVLELQDDFTTGMARAAAATALLDRELDGLGRGTAKAQKGLSGTRQEIDGAGKSAAKAERDIDKFSGRLSILRDVALTLGPGLAPLGALSAAAISGLASQLGFTVAATGTAILAFQNVGTALEALDKARLEPTVENLNAADAALRNLAPSAQGFVRQIEAMEPALEGLRNVAADGIFPGFTRGLQGAESALPRVKRVVSAISTELGDIGANLGEAIESGRLNDFLDFLEREAPLALGDMAEAAGNSAHALLDLWMATTPLNRDFSKWLVSATADLDAWAEALGQTDGFAEFVAYVRKNGPQVGRTISEIADAVLQVVEAAAPLGGPALKALEAVAGVVADIADSDLGTPIFAGVAALTAYNRVLQVTKTLQTSTFGKKFLPQGTFKSISEEARAGIPSIREFGTVAYRAGQSAKNASVETLAARNNVRRFAGSVGSAAAPIAGVALATSGLADKVGLTNTVSLGLIGTLGGPWGAALGSAAGFALDFSHANDDVTASVQRAQLAIESNSQAQIDAARASLIAQQSALSQDSDNAVVQFGLNFKRLAAQVTGASGDISDELYRLGLAQRDLTNGSQGVGRLLTQDLGPGAQQAASDLDGAARATARFNDQLSIMQGRLGQAQTLVSLRTAIRGLKDVVDQNPLGRGLSTNLDTDAGKQGDVIRGQLLSIIQLTQQAAEGLTGVDQIGFLRHSRAEILQRAQDLGVSVETVEKLLTRMGIVDKTKIAPKVDPKPAKRGLEQVGREFDRFLNRGFAVDVNANTDPAVRQVQTLLNFINGLTATVDVNATTNHQVGGLGPLLTPITPADGTTVPGSRFPYGDRVPALLAPSEEVISNRHGQADRWRPFLKAINANKLADGGTAGGGPWSWIPRNLHLPVPDSFREWNFALQRSTKIVERETAKRDELLSKREDLSSQIAGSFRSDLFGPKDAPDTSVWAKQAKPQSALGNLFGTLRGDITNATAFNAALSTLHKKGLDGQAFAEIAGSGNLAAAQELAGMSAANVQRYERLFNRRQNLTGTFGAQNAQIAYGAQIAAQTKHLDAIRHQNLALQRKVDTLVKAAQEAPEKTGKAVGKAIDVTAAKAKR